MPWQYDREDDWNVYNLFIICKNINKNKQKAVKCFYSVCYCLFLDAVWCGSVASGRGAEGETKWQTLANWNADRAREKEILDRWLRRRSRKQQRPWRPSPDGRTGGALAADRAAAGGVVCQAEGKRPEGGGHRGGYDAVIVTKKGVVEGSEVCDHGLLTQFLLPENNRKDSYKVVWEKSAPCEKCVFPRGDSPAVRGERSLPPSVRYG